MKSKICLLFLCTGNSCRSQIAEGWTRSLKSEFIEVYSAGIETHGLNPSAVKVMNEAGVDISLQHSKPVNDLSGLSFDYVVTLCDHASQHCPLFSGDAENVHKGFADPPALAAQVALRGGDEEDQLDCYRRVRDQIHDWVKTLPDSLET